MNDLKQKEITEKIIGSVFAVSKFLAMDVKRCYENKFRAIIKSVQICDSDNL